MGLARNKAKKGTWHISVGQKRYCACDTVCEFYVANCSIMFFCVLPRKDLEKL